MKIKISFISTLFSFVLLFASCQKDGLYTPKEHLTRIENWEFYDGDSLFRNAEEWEWDGKLLSKITYLDRARTPYATLTPSYDSKNRIESFLYEESGMTWTYQYNYHNNDLYQILVYDQQGEERGVTTFKKKGGKVAEITLEAYMVSSQNPLRFILPPEVVELPAAKASGSSQRTTYQLTWKGNDVVKYVVLDGNADDKVISTVETTYDNNVNPYQGMLANTNGYSNINGTFSKHNPLTIDNTGKYNLVDEYGNEYADADYEVHETYTYEYEGRYPVKQVRDIYRIFEGRPLSYTLKRTYTYE